MYKERLRIFHALQILRHHDQLALIILGLVSSSPSIILAFDTMLPHRNKAKGSKAKTATAFFSAELVPSPAGSFIIVALRTACTSFP